MVIVAYNVKRIIHLLKMRPAIYLAAVNRENLLTYGKFEHSCMFSILVLILLKSSCCILSRFFPHVTKHLPVPRANLVIQCENWWNLAKQFARRNPPLHFLPSSVQRTLMKALVLGGFAHMDTDTKQQYWTEVRVVL